MAEVKEPHHEGEFSIERLIIATSVVQTNPMRFKRQLGGDVPERPLWKNVSGVGLLCARPPLHRITFWLSQNHGSRFQPDQGKAHSWKIEIQGSLGKGKVLGFQ